MITNMEYKQRIRQSVEEFVLRVDLMISYHLTQKLRLIGVYEEDYKDPDATEKLDLGKRIIKETPEEIVEEYTAKGISLLTVVWTPMEAYIVPNRLTINYNGYTK